MVAAAVKAAVAVVTAAVAAVTAMKTTVVTMTILAEATIATQVAMMMMMMIAVAVAAVVAIAERLTVNIFELYIFLHNKLTSGDPKCPAKDGKDSVYIPHEDCTKFWQCSNGVPYLFDCPANLHFNPTLNVCDWPEQAGCTGNGGESNESTD